MMWFLEAAKWTLQNAAKQLSEADRIWADDVLHQMTANTNDLAYELEQFFRSDRSFSWHDDAEVIAETLAEYLGELVQERRSIFAAQAVWQHIDHWLDAIEQIISQQAGRTVCILPENRPVCPLQVDKDVELIKLLHGEGMTREELAEQLHLTPRAVQNKLAALGPASPHMPPLRIAGQAMHVSISSKRIQPEYGTKKNTKRFYTPNTLHPIALQLNIAQLLTLFYALYQNYECNYSNMSEIIALDNWVQLSGYAKDRLQKLAGDPNGMLLPYSKEYREGFMNYLNNMEAAVQDECHNAFRTERDLIRDGFLTQDEEVVLLYKAGRTCNICWIQGGKPQKLRNQIIRSIHPDTIETVSAEDLEGPVHTLLRSWNLKFMLCDYDS